MKDRNVEIKISGIYDKRTLDHLRMHNVNSFGFDFRPKSMNFIQGHVLNQLQGHLSEFDNIYLHFENDPDFMVENILDHFQDTNLSPILTFSGTQGIQYYEKFKDPFIWFYDEKVKFTDIIKSEYCKGIYFSLEYLRMLHEQGVFHNFVSNFYSSLYKIRNELNLYLKVESLIYLFPTLFEYFDFYHVDYTLNSEVEVCYRNVDMKKLNSQIKNLQLLKSF